MRGLLLIILMNILPTMPSAAQVPGEGTNPGGAISAPDAYAWQLFEELNRDAGTGDGRVVWETWKNANNPRDIFLRDGSEPPPWDAPRPAVRALDDLEALPLQLQILRREQGLPQVLFDPNVGTGNEVRMNRAAFEFVLANELYHRAGQVAFFSQQDPHRPTGFPLQAKEIKAQWRPLQEGQDPARFHTAKLPGTDKVWGLTALHITTKDVPNWFWATFEHKDNPLREVTVPSVDRAGLPESLSGTKWENYVLRGTQIDFTTPIGKPTILANSQIEASFEETSSCITCHSRAAVRLREGRFEMIPIFQSRNPAVGNVGGPLLEWFEPPGEPRFLQTDFVWSLARAAVRAPSE